jgi:hypothetical protein
MAWNRNDMEEDTRQSDAGESREESELRRAIRTRIDVRLRVTFTLADGKTSDAFGRANNLSHGGIEAYIPCPLRKNAAVTLELTFPGCAREAKVKAVVRYSDGFRYGLEFSDVSREVREMISKTCGPERG